MGNERLGVARARMKEKGIDSLLVAGRFNIRYITGFKGDYGYACVTSDGFRLYTSALYEEDARAQVPGGCDVIASKDDIIGMLTRDGSDFWGNRIGYEAETLVCSSFMRIRDAMSFAEFIPTAGIIEDIRTTKDPGEIQAITAAQEITDRVFDEILGQLAEGVSERDLANEIDYRFRSYGAERPAFETIVASGANSSKPHAVPGRRTLIKGDLVLFDMGACIDGYASDMTRTVVLGHADADQRERYRLVLDAQEASLDSIREGVHCSEPYDAALAVFERAGVSDRFIHSLGHGLGIEVHEHPRLSPGVHEQLRANTVVTVEPGLYFPGWGGIRIEDMVVVGDGGCENLTKSPKKLIEI